MVKRVVMIYFVIPGQRERGRAKRGPMTAASPESITTIVSMDSGPAPRGRVPE
jgi:hypothetical protein